MIEMYCIRKWMYQKIEIPDDYRIAIVSKTVEQSLESNYTNASKLKCLDGVYKDYKTLKPPSF